MITKTKTPNNKLQLNPWNQSIYLENKLLENKRL